MFGSVFDNLDVVNQLEKLGKERPAQEPAAIATLNSYLTFASRNLVASRRALAAFNKLSPPPKFRQDHTYFRASMNQLVIGATALDRTLAILDFNSFGRFTSGFDLFMAYQKKGFEAIKAARR